MHKFLAEIEIIGVNPFVFVPDDILREIFSQVGRERGPIPVQGTVNGKTYRQTLVRYSGDWRLYINTTMLKNSPKKIGETIEVTIDFDRASRAIEPPQSFVRALAANEAAKTTFDLLAASKKLEIVRYLANLKTEEALEKNVVRAVRFLVGQGRFAGREKP